MKQEHTTEHAKGRRKKRPSRLLVLPILAIIVIGALFFLTSKQHREFTAPAEPGKKPNTLLEGIAQIFSGLPGDRKAPADQPQKPEAAQNQAAQHEPEKPPEAASGAETGQAAAPNMSPASPQDPEMAGKTAADTITAFFTRLDAQPSIQALHLEKSGKAYLLDCLQTLLDTPPTLSRETDDLTTVLKNTAHFYRVLGKDNLPIVKTILDQEKSSLEDITAAFYALSACPACANDAFSLRIPPDALYNYAGFFLNTMGGRMYLFRRDAVSRMIVTYYSILIIDKANAAANNRNGIPIKPSIDTLISDMESSGDQLKQKERYLDKLYELKEKYQ